MVTRPITSKDRRRKYALTDKGKAEAKKLRKL
jgi:DNA-binding PadR family transcriptional regulator